MVEAQGGDPRVADDPAAVLPRAPVVVPLVADRTGILATIEAEAIGLASGALGAGRLRKGDPVDPAVGIVVRPKIGDRVEAGEPIGEVHARSRTTQTQAAAQTLASLRSPRARRAAAAGPRLVPARRAVGTRMIAVGNFTALGFRLAVYMLASLLVGMSLREYARARTATSLWGPDTALVGPAHADARSRGSSRSAAGASRPCIAVLWTVQTLVIPAAYGKPAPIDPRASGARTRRRARLARRTRRDVRARHPRRAHRAGPGRSAGDVRALLTFSYTSMSPHDLPPAADPGPRRCADGGPGAPARRRHGLPQRRQVPPAGGAGDRVPVQLARDRTADDVHRRAL